MAHRAKQEADLRGWPDSKNADRFVALAKEQLALMADDRFHAFSFGLGVEFCGGFAGSLGSSR